MLGVLLVYFLNLNWIQNKQDLMNSLIDNFRTTYNLQNKILDNSDRVLEEVVDCALIKQEECDIEATRIKVNGLSSERDRLTVRLENLNKNTEKITFKLTGSLKENYGK
jgi:hypothetical protein